LKQAEALSSKATRLLEKITSLRRGLFLNRLFEPQTSPFNIDLWKGAIDTYIAQLSSYKLVPQNIGKGALVPITISSILFFVIFFVAAFLSKKRLRIKLQDDDGKQSIFSMVSASLFLAFVAIGLFIIYQTLITQHIINDTNGFFIHKCLMLTGFLFFVFCLFNDETFFKHENNSSVFTSSNFCNSAFIFNRCFVP